MSKLTGAIDGGCRRVFVGITVIVFAGSLLSLLWAILFAAGEVRRWLAS